MSERRPIDVEHLIAEARGLRRLAVRLVGESDADDVLQDTIVAGIEHAPDRSREIRPWLVRVVRNFAAGKRRGEGRRTARETEAAQREPAPSASDLVARIEVQRLVAEEVLRLDEPYRRAVLAVYFEGLGAEEYARRLGVPSATVRSWLKRGLDALRMRLDRRFGGDRSAWSACLLPLARLESALVPVGVVGGLLMKKLIAASLVLVLTALVAWTVFGVGANDDVALVASAAVELTEPEADAPREALAPASSSEARAEIALAPDVVAAEIASGPGVAGRVLWLPDRGPAAEIGVRLAPTDVRPDREPPPWVVTDAEGRFRFDAVAPGQYELSIDRAPSSRRFTVGADGAPDVELTLQRAARVFGRVLALDGTPVADAQVCVGTELWSRCVTRSGADGGYSVEGMPATGRQIFARASGHAASGVYTTGENVLRDFRERPEVSPPYALDLWLGGVPGALAVRVTDAAGNPLAGMQVEICAERETVTDPAGVRASALQHEYATTDELGEFAFAGLRAGRTVVHVHALHRTKCSVAVDVRAGATTHADVVLPATARVRGRITDLTGKPAGGAQFEAVRADGTSASTWIPSDADGNYDTGFVPAGRVRLTARHNRGRAELETDLAPGEDREWSPVLGAMSPIRGRVVDVAGRPLAGISVSQANRKQPQALTDAAGRFELLVPAAGFAWVTTWASDGAMASGNRAVWPGGPDIELVFDPASAKIVGRLLDTSGMPAPQHLGCADRTFPCDATGRFESPLLQSGSHALIAYGYGVAACTVRTIELAPGQTLDLGDVALPACGTLVVAPHFDGAVDRHRVEFRAQRLGPGLQIVSSQGRNAGADWTAEGLPEGDYVLTATGGGAALFEKKFTIRAGASTLLDVEVRRGSPIRVEVRGERITGWELAVRDAAGELVGKPSRNPWSDSALVVVLRPGRYELVATGTDGRTGRARVEVKGDAALEQYVAIEIP